MNNELRNPLAYEIKSYQADFDCFGDGFDHSFYIKYYDDQKNVQCIDIETERNFRIIRVFENKKLNQNVDLSFLKKLVATNRSNLIQSAGYEYAEKAASELEEVKRIVSPKEYVELVDRKGNKIKLPIFF